MVNLGKDKKLIRENLYARDTMSKIYYDKVADIARERERLEREKERLEKEKLEAAKAREQRIEEQRLKEQRQNTRSSSSEAYDGVDNGAGLVMVAMIIMTAVLVFTLGKSMMKSGTSAVEKIANESISSEYAEVSDGTESVSDKYVEQAQNTVNINR